MFIFINSSLVYSIDVLFLLTLHLFTHSMFNFSNSSLINLLDVLAYVFTFLLTFALMMANIAAIKFAASLLVLFAVFITGEYDLLTFISTPNEHINLFVYYPYLIIHVISIYFRVPVFSVSCHHCEYNILRNNDGNDIWDEGDPNCVEDPDNTAVYDCVGICQVSTLKGEAKVCQINLSV